MAHKAWEPIKAYSELVFGRKLWLSLGQPTLPAVPARCDKYAGRVR